MNVEQTKLITLTKDHKHGDVQYYAGQTVALPADVVDWLIETRQAEKVASRNLLLDESIERAVSMDDA